MIRHSALFLLAVLTFCLGALPTQAQTGWGSALVFDGATGYVELARPISRDFTIEFWFQSTQVTGSDSQWYLGTGLVDAEVGGLKNDFGLSLGAGRVLFGTGNPDKTIASTALLADGTWHHVAATRQKATGTLKLFVDGVQDATIDTGNTSELVDSPIIRLGSLATGLNFFQGRIDEVRIWDVVRSPAQIQSNRVQRLSGAESGLVTYYRFDEAAGIVAGNGASTGSAFNGALNGPAWIASSVPFLLTQAADDCTPTTAMLNGLVNPNGLNTVARFQWGTSANFDRTTLTKGLGNGTNAVPVSVLLTGLTTDVTYFYRIVANNTLGAAYGASRSFRIVAVTKLEDGGAGSLRQAIADAVPGTTILLTNTGTITLTNEIGIHHDLTISGPGAASLAISGTNKWRIFNVTNATVEISGLTLRDGHSSDGTTGNPGTPGAPGGGIFNAGILTLNDCVLTNNRAGNGGAGSGGGTDQAGASGGAGGDGGAVYNHSFGTLTLNRCSISSNFTGNGGGGGAGGHGYSDSGFFGGAGHHGGGGGPGGMSGSGAGIYDSGMLVLNQCLLGNNSCGLAGRGGDGGGGGDSGSFYSGRWGGGGGGGGIGGNGGGVCNVGAVQTVLCTFSGNKGGGGGTGGSGGHAGSGGMGSGGAGGAGGGGAGGSGAGFFNMNSITLLGCTIASNAAGTGGTGAAGGRGGGIVNQAGAKVQLVNTIVGLNTSVSTPDDVFGAFASQGHNLIGATYGGTGFVTNDLLNVHPQLGPLANYTGPTWTQTLLPGSPAIDTGDNASAPAADQRGLPRIANGIVDIGAIEYQYWPIIQTLTASEVMATGQVASATLNGIVNPDGPMATTAWFEWDDGVARHQTPPFTVESGTSDVAVSASVTGLTAGLTYRYRLVATNAVGYAHGEELRFCAPFVTDNGDNPLTWICHDVFVDPGVTVGNSPITIAAGSMHSLALKADGTVIGWAASNFNQTISPDGLNNAVAIAAGFNHSLALKANGTVIGWGDNSENQAASPDDLASVVAIAAGYYHSLALKVGGSIVGWGKNSYGQAISPVGLTNVTAIAAGFNHSMALKADGTVLVWGDNTYNQTNCPAGLNNVVAIAAGSNHSMALKADGTVLVWGDNSFSQIKTPVGLTNVVAIAAGAYHNLALKADGRVVAWGNNTYKQTNIPVGLSNVVAIAAGANHSLALKSDGNVVGWGNNMFGEIDIPAGLNIIDVAIGVTGLVQVNYPGSYVLTYTTTNAFGGVGLTTRTVEVIPATAIVTTQPATDLTSTAATLRGIVTPRGATTRSWFEYGLTTKYGYSTALRNLGSYPNDFGVNGSLTGLLPWMTYHFRAVASNSVGRTDGFDSVFTLTGPFGAAPALSAFQDVTLPQGGSTSIPFTVSSAMLEVRVRCNNSVLLPNGRLLLGGIGASRSLSLAPDPNHSGSAQVVVTASDGMHTTSRTFTLMVTPMSDKPVLYLTDAKKASAEAWRFRVYDSGAACTNYVVEYQSNLAPTNVWTVATNVSWLGSDTVQVNSGPSQGNSGFYRVNGIRWLTGGLGSQALTMEEGAVTGPVVVFNGLYTGPVQYRWSDASGALNSGTLQVNGTTAVIPFPPACAGDNADIGRLNCLTVRLDAGSNYALTGFAESSVTIEENDAFWQGTLVLSNGLAATAATLMTNLPSGGYTNITLPQNANMTLGFTLQIVQTNGCFQGRIQSDGYGLLPIQALAQLTLMENTFTAVATDAVLPALTASPLFSGASYMDLRLDAANVPGQTNVRPTQISGVAVLVSKVPGQPYLDSAVFGTFVLLKPATASPTNQVPLYNAR